MKRDARDISPPVRVASSVTNWPITGDATRTVGGVFRALFFTLLSRYNVLKKKMPQYLRSPYMHEKTNSSDFSGNLRPMGHNESHEAEISPNERGQKPSIRAF